MIGALISELTLCACFLLLGVTVGVKLSGKSDALKNKGSEKIKQGDMMFKVGDTVRIRDQYKKQFVFKVDNVLEVITVFGSGDIGVKLGSFRTRVPCKYLEKLRR